VGPAGVSWYGVGDLEDDGCGEIGTVLQSFDDQAEYSPLGDAFGVRRVLRVLEPKSLPPASYGAAGGWPPCNPCSLRAQGKVWRAARR
jgi:hypothetical protein